MVELTPNFAGNTLIIMLIGYVIVLAYSLYMAYLGWKQAKVSKQMDKVIEILEQIRDENG